MPLVSSVDTVYTTYSTTFAWRSLTTGTIFPLVFISKSDSLFFGTPSPLLQVRQTASECVIERISVCVLLLVSILLARVQTM